MKENKIKKKKSVQRGKKEKNYNTNNKAKRDKNQFYINFGHAIHIINVIF